MKIIIQPFLDKYGGAERKTMLLAEAYKKKAMNFELITWKYNSKYYSNLGLQHKIKVIKAKNFTTWIVKVIFRIFTNKNITDIYAINYPSNIIAGISSFLTFNKIKSAWMCNEVSFLVNTKRSLIKKIIFGLGELLCIQFINVIHVNSKTTFNNLSKTYLKKANKVIYSGIDTKYYDDLITKNQIDNKFIKKDINFLYIGRIEKHKGIDILLKIAEKNPHKIIMMIGNGSYLKQFKAKANFLKNIRFLGNCSDLKKISFISRSKLLLFPSPNEPLGVVLIEAIYCGLKVLAFNKGGPCEIIRHNIDGYLTDSENRFIKLASNFNEDQIQCIHNNNKKYIKSKFNQKNMISEMLKAWD
tara:strand:+ start:136 stop:1206 length:1071 start_codon:yes stop_codon:yes gene_type:complete